MKKTIFIFSILILFVSTSYATTVVYRSSSGEVAVISIGNNPFSEFCTSYFTVVTDPTFQDGTETDFRTLGLSKIFDSGIVRNATQVEINGFKAFEIEDRNIRQEIIAKSYFQTDPKFRRAVIAVIKGIIREDNILRNWTRDFKDLVAASTSLADFKARVAAEDTLINREFDDAKTYILNQVSKDD